MGGLVLPLILPLLLSVSEALSAIDWGDSPVTCTSASVQCDYNETNLIEEVAHVDTLSECRTLCLDNFDCQFISYHDANATPFKHLCQLFRSCESVTQASNCVSENMQCFETCGFNKVGILDENILVLTPNVELEQTCKNKCIQNDNCSFYTYFHGNDSLYHETCALLTEILPPIQDCDTCVTGPVDCSSNTQQCFLAIHGEFYQSLKVTNTSGSQNLTVIGPASCELRILAVGGGGKDASEGHVGGAGSGYLQYRVMNLDPGTIVSMDVGDLGEPSTVTIVNTGETITADPGQGGHSSTVGGGDGYCGGGGSASYTDHIGGYGGTNGGDGEDGTDGQGGKGTGEDISQFTFTSWSLSPGAGGSEYYGAYGGGGGGVLVDGAGPEATMYQGQGFGGGASGAGVDYDKGDGLQGIILIETTSV